MVHRCKEISKRINNRMYFADYCHCHGWRAQRKRLGRCDYLTIAHIIGHDENIVAAQDILKEYWNTRAHAIAWLVRHSGYSIVNASSVVAQIEGYLYIR